MSGWAWISIITYFWRFEAYNRRRSYTDEPWPPYKPWTKKGTSTFPRLWMGQGSLLHTVKLMVSSIFASIIAEDWIKAAFVFLLLKWGPGPKSIHSWAHLVPVMQLESHVIRRGIREDRTPTQSQPTWISCLTRAWACSSCVTRRDWGETDIMASC